MIFTQTEARKTEEYTFSFLLCSTFEKKTLKYLHVEILPIFLFSFKWLFLRKEKKYQTEKKINRSLKKSLNPKTLTVEKKVIKVGISLYLYICIIFELTSKHFEIYQKRWISMLKCYIFMLKM